MPEYRRILDIDLPQNQSAFLWGPRKTGKSTLLRALNRGLVPQHYDSARHRRALSGYVDDYLKEEVFDEGLTRSVAAFSRFFDALAFCHGELLNYSNEVFLERLWAGAIIS